MRSRTLCCCKLVTVMIAVEQTSFTAAHVSLAVTDSLVNFLIPTHTWPSTNTAVEYLSNLCATEPHTPPKATDGASKNHGPCTGSIIDFIPKLLLRTHYALHTNGWPFPERQAGWSNYHQRLCLWIGRLEARAGSYNKWLVDDHICTQIHTGMCTHNEF